VLPSDADAAKAAPTDLPEPHIWMQHDTEPCLPLTAGLVDILASLLRVLAASTGRFRMACCAATSSDTGARAAVYLSEPLASFLVVAEGRHVYVRLG